MKKQTKAIMLDFKGVGEAKPYYIQLYDYIREAILKGEMHSCEKLPSLRVLAKSLEISVTTVEGAYNQLLLEGYIEARPQSGYYIREGFDLQQASPAAAQAGWMAATGTDQAAQAGWMAATGTDQAAQAGWMATTQAGPAAAQAGLAAAQAGPAATGTNQATQASPAAPGVIAPPQASGPAKDLAAGPAEPRALETILANERATQIYDTSAFDFSKWKKCTDRVLTDYARLLTFESDPQGEEALRSEIAHYIFNSRGVQCSPEQIVIGAGTQQLTLHLTRILKELEIGHVAVEEPGYLPVKRVFKEHGFVMTPVEVDEDGIRISRLPSNIRSAVYVSPSNQFPTGAVMPIGKRYELLEWANQNDSIIIEDDYDSELRYFGRPIPAMQGLDKSQRVIYLGSFSSTLFPAIKISYMVLTPQLLPYFYRLKSGYTQTCSKTEQLTLALFMSQGFYASNIKKLRSRYSQKLQATTAALNKFGKGLITIQSASSGLNIIVSLEGTPGNTRDNGTHSAISPAELCEAAHRLGIQAVPVSAYADRTHTSENSVVLYYHQLPLPQIPALFEQLFSQLRQHS